MHTFDVFISYAQQDVAWVRMLVGRLDAAGFRVFFDEYAVSPGEVVTHSLEEGIRSSAAGVLVCSPASMASARVMDQYAALQDRAVDGGRPLIPVLYQDAEPPVFVGSRRWVDFRHADGPAYDARVGELVHALRGLPPPRPGATPADGRVRPERARAALFKPGADRVEVVDLERNEVTTATPEPPKLAGRLADLERARGADRAVVLREIGASLGTGYAGTALRPIIDDAHGHGAELRLGIQPDDALADLPWEALVIPGDDRPIALLTDVQPYRVVDAGATVPAVGIPAPLRILVVLAGPEGADGGPPLDVERELATILDAVEPARKHARAYVRVLNLGTLDAIREALAVERFHVLHISCPAGPHELLLEDDQGRAQRVTASELIAAIPPERRPAVVVLAGCSTARAQPVLARELLRAGVPQVVAMTAPVTDRYATLFGGHLYRELAVAQEPGVVTAAAQARRRVEADADLVEWAAPVVFVRGTPMPLYDPAAAAEPPFAVGDFVGRRADLRTLLAALRKPGSRGVLLHGIGGVGKSSLAAEVLRLLGHDAGLIVPVVGATGPDRILNAFAAALHRQAVATGAADRDPRRELATQLRRPAEPWQSRLETALDVLADRPVTLLLDNFESNLDPRPSGPAAIRDATLADFLSVWIRTPGAHRVLLTSRYPFPERRLTTHHLGPLSPAETRKLIWRLPGLDALTTDQQQQAWRDVGGHPRTLEYLDALLRKGEARFADVTGRLEELLAERGIAVSGFDEAITQAVDDTLLHDLLDLLDEESRRLLVETAVHRRPVAVADQRAEALCGLGLLTPVRGDEPAYVVHRWTASALTRLHPEATRKAHDLAAGYYTRRFQEIEQDAYADIDDLIEARHHHHAAGDLTAAIALTYQIKEQLDTWAAWDWEISLCEETLTWLPPDSYDAAAFIHQLGMIASRRGDYTEAQRRAEQALAIADRLGNRNAVANSYGQLGNLAYLVGDHATAKRWYAQAIDLFEELGNRGKMAGGYHQLGMIAHDQSDYPEAERQYLEALSIFEELGIRANMASSYHQLGSLAQDRGDVAEAERRYRQSLAIKEAMGNRAGVSHTYGQLGGLALDQGELAAAQSLYERALTISEELGDRTAMAASYHRLGVLAHNQDDHAEAKRRYQQALAISEELGDRASIAYGYGQLGNLARDRGDHAEAERRYRQTLAISEELGDRASIATCYTQMGALYAATRRHGEAVPLHCLALSIRQTLRIPGVSVDMRALAGLRADLGDEAFRRAAAGALDEKSVSWLLAELLPGDRRP